VSPLCSRNARLEKALVGRAQWETHPGHPRDNVPEQAWKDDLWPLAATALDGHFEHLVSRFCATIIRKIPVDFLSRNPVFLQPARLRRIRKKSPFSPTRPDAA